MEAGRIGRAHGLDGSFHVTGAEEWLPALDASVTVAGRAHRITRRAGTVERPILRLSDVTTRDAAEALRGESLLVPRPPLEEDEVWAEDLIGAPVTDAGRAVGQVARVLAYPSCEVLVVAREQGDLLVPLVADAVRSASPDGVDVDLEFLGES